MSAFRICFVICHEITIFCVYVIVTYVFIKLVRLLLLVTSNDSFVPIVDTNGVAEHAIQYTLWNVQCVALMNQKCGNAIRNSIPIIEDANKYGKWVT